MTSTDQLERELRRAVRRRSPQPVKRRSHHRRGLAVVASAAVAFGSVAYAAESLWQPVLGHDPDSRPTATAGELPSSLLEQVPAFARPQTASDRDQIARFALQGGDSSRKVLTNSVRRLGSTSDGTPITLIPVIDGDQLEICLFLGNTEMCGAPSDIAEGRLVIGAGRTKASQAARDRQAAAITEWLKEDPGGGALPDDPVFKPLDANVLLVGVVPTQATVVTLPDGSTAPVNDDGIFEGEVPETAAARSGLSVSWER